MKKPFNVPSDQMAYNDDDNPAGLYWTLTWTWCRFMVDRAKLKKKVI